MIPSPRPSSLRWGLPLVGAALVASSLPAAPAAAGGGDPAVAGAPVAGRPADPRPADPPPAGRGPRIQWHACDGPAVPGQQCATYRVPFDYQHPGRGTFRLAVSRIKASGPASERMGSLFFNPGGPGGAGVPTVKALDSVMADPIKRRFHLVSWDPRGIGETRPVLRECGQPWPVRPATGAVDWRRVEKRSHRKLRAVNRRCQQENARFIGHMGTVDVARDLDALRRAVGDRRLNLWGASYGTRIGYTYATLFPRRVGALVLDGNIDPTGDYLGLTEGGIGPDTALRFIRKVRPDYFDVFRRAFVDLGKRPITLPDGSRYTRWDLVDTTMSMTGSQSRWEDIAALAQLALAARRDDAQGKAALAQLAQQSKGPDTNSGAAFSVVNCLDYADRPSRAQRVRAIRRNVADGPFFAGSLTTDYAIGCAGLDLEPDPVPDLDRPRLRARVADLTVQVSNATKDAFTPLPWAKRMHRSFAGSGMVTYRGTQHVIWNFLGDSCVNDPINRYVLTGRLLTGLRCPFRSPTAR